MKILWLTWKDREHPLAGGAEVVNEELAKRLVQDGHEVTFLVGDFKIKTKNQGPSEKLASESALRAARPSLTLSSATFTDGPQDQNQKQYANTTFRDGFKIIRLGNRFSVYWRAYHFYKKHLYRWPDLVIDEVNTIPFFAKFYSRQKNILFIHQLCREIWFYQMPFPLSLVGYVLEPIYLWLLARGSTQVVTVSESSKADLTKFGFKPEHIHIISEGTELKPLSYLSLVSKFDVPTILSVGAIRPMKRTHDIVSAFEILKAFVPNARLIVAGASDNPYGQKVLEQITSSPFAKDIRYTGPVTPEQKAELMQKCHVHAVASIKEGWGLVVTEANSQGTPAAVYNVDGLRDSVKSGETGVVAKTNTPQGLADALTHILTGSDYEQLRQNAWEWSQSLTFDNSYNEFRKILQSTQNKRLIEK